MEKQLETIKAQKTDLLGEINRLKDENKYLKAKTVKSRENFEKKACSWVINDEYVPKTARTETSRLTVSHSPQSKGKETEMAWTII